MIVVSFLQLNKKIFNMLQGKQPYLENVCVSVIERPNKFYLETPIFNSIYKPYTINWENFKNVYATNCTRFMVFSTT